MVWFYTWAGLKKFFSLEADEWVIREHLAAYLYIFVELLAMALQDMTPHFAIFELSEWLAHNARAGNQGIALRNENFSLPKKF